VMQTADIGASPEIVKCVCVYNIYAMLFILTCVYMYDIYALISYFGMCVHVYNI